jgi:predicted Zn-dependent peptidase
MLGMGKELLDYGKLISLDEFLHKIEQVSAPELQTLAIQYFSPESISSITYIPTEDE